MTSIGYGQQLKGAELIPSGSTAKENKLETGKYLLAQEKIIRGVIGIGIGAAIAESNRNNRNNSTIIIIERERELEERGYYDELYKCEHLAQGGYYIADELEECLREN